MDQIIQLDEALFLWINTTLTHPWADWFLPRYTDFHKTLYFQGALIAGLLALIWHSQRRKSIAAILGLGVTLAINDYVCGKIIKPWVARERPFVALEEAINRCPAGGYSFVSNHAANMFCFAIFAGTLIPWIRWPAITFAVLTSYSRIYCGVHYPADVIAGAALGSFWGWIAALGFQKWRKNPWPKFL